MIVEINGDKTIEIDDDNLIVKGKTLYNTKTKLREGIDGDVVSFIRTENDRKIQCRGTVDGYTYGKRIKIRGVDEPYQDIHDIHFEHVSVITKFDDFGINSEEK